MVPLDEFFVSRYTSTNAEFFSIPNAGEYGPEKTPYFDNFHAVLESLAAESFWFSSIASHPASDLSAILTNLFVFLSLSLIDDKELWADSVSLFRCFRHE